MGLIEWIIVIFLVWFVFNRFVPVKGITNITVQEAKDKFSDRTVQFIDVRTAGEFHTNHRPPFKNIPLHDLPNKMDNLKKENEVVVVCQSGMRSMKAAKMLKKHEFHSISNVKGGMGAWH